MNPQLDFFNSTAQSKEERFNEKVQATSQAFLIKAFFKVRPIGRYTTVDVARSLKLNLNSTRRAMNQLETKWHILEKLEGGQREPSTGNKFNHYYRWNMK